MLNWLSRLFFDEEEKSDFETLADKSANAIGVIESMLNTLKATNEKVNEQKDVNKQVIAELEKEQRDLDSLKAKNTRIITNFEKMLYGEDIRG